MNIRVGDWVRLRLTSNDPPVLVSVAGIERDDSDRVASLMIWSVGEDTVLIDGELLDRCYMERATLKN